MTTRAIAASVLAACVMASAAWAETKVIASSGDWKAFGGTTDQTPPVGVCGVSRDTNNQYFGLKLFAKEDTFTIQMGSKHWASVAEKQRIGVTMIIDGNDPWNATGSTFRFADGDMGIEFDINKEQVSRYMGQFRGGTHIRIRFASPAMPEWSLSLKGTDQLTDAFMACTLGLK